MRKIRGSQAVTTGPPAHSMRTPQDRQGLTRGITDRRRTGEVHVGPFRFSVCPRRPRGPSGVVARLSGTGTRTTRAPPGRPSLPPMTSSGDSPPFDGDPVFAGGSATAFRLHTSSGPTI